jgi:hypothetical protein
MIGGKLSTQREKPAHLVGQLPGLLRGALHALVFLLVFSSARFALHLIGLVVSDEFPIRFSMAFFSGSTISSSTSSLRIAWDIGGFCISPRNEYTVSGGYAKTPILRPQPQPQKLTFPHLWGILFYLPKLIFSMDETFPFTTALARQLWGSDASRWAESQTATQKTRLGTPSVPNRGHVCLFLGSFA